MEKTHILYKTTNLINNKIYVGIHSTDNLDDGYLGSGKVIKRAITKHGKENFKREILQEFNTREAALAEEAKIVDGNFIRRPDVYNTNTGGGHNWYGMVTVKDKDGNIFQVAKDDPRWLSGKLVGHSKDTTHPGLNSGHIVVKDANGNITRVSNDDPRYVSGELVHHTKGTVTAKDKDGNTLSISVDDPRYVSGELVPLNKNMFIAIDKDGKRHRISKDDPRYLSGELVHHNKGRKLNRKKQVKTVKCPHCRKEGKQNLMKRWHFDNCKQL